MGYWTDRGTGFEPRTWKEWFVEFAWAMLGFIIGTGIVLVCSMYFPQTCTVPHL